ncbi:hypothetical protein IW146_006266 [Coemansia sp. RSA 922]|nr:hypothetical protein IW146_006266 [Coemansia sp. RSA 922]
MAWVFVPCLLVRVLLWSIHIFGLFGLFRMFAGIKLLWLVAGKVLTAITIQFDNFDPFDEPYDPEPLVTSRFLRQLYLNDNNSSVPRTGGITHIPDGEADDDGSDDDVDNSDAGLPRLRVDNEADVKVSGQRTQVDDAGADVNLSGERTQAIDTSVDTILPEQRALDDDASVDNGSDAEDAEQDPPSNDMADGDSDAEDTEQRAQVDDAGSQPEDTSATDAPIQDATLVNGTGLLHVVEPPPAVMEMEVVNPPVEVDIEERPPVADLNMADAEPPADDDLEMEAMNQPVNDDLEERPPVADLVMADAEPPTDDDLDMEDEEPTDDDADMEDEDSASNNNVQKEVYVPILDAASVEARAESLGRPIRKLGKPRPANTATGTLPLNPMYPVTGAFNSGSFNFDNQQANVSSSSTSRATVNVPVFNSGNDAIAWLKDTSGANDHQSYTLGQAATGPLPDTSHIDMAALAQSFGQAGAEGNTLLANNLGPGNGTAFDNSAELGALLLSLGDQWLSNYNATGGNVQIANSSVTDALVPNLANMGGGDDAQLPNDADASALLLSLGNPQTNNSAGTGGNAQAGHYPGLANPGDTQLLSDADASALLLSLGLTSTGDNTIFAGNTGTGANQWFNNNPINVGNMPVAGNMGSAAPEYNGVFMNMDDMVTYYNGLPVAEQAQLFNQAPSGNQAPAMPIADTALLGNNMLFGNNPGADTLQLNFDSLSAGANMFDNNPGVDAFNLDYGAGILPLGPLLPGLDLPPNPVVHGNFNDGANDFFQETGILAAPGILGQDNTAVGDAGNAAEVPNDILNFDALLGWANNIDEETLAQVDAHLAAVGYKFEGEQQPMPTMITAPTTPVDSTGTHESGGGPNV